MCNYPPGAENDPRAPYNELEKVFSFELTIKGKIYVTYSGYLDEEETYNEYKKLIEGKISDALRNEGDISTEIANFEIY